MWTLKKKEGFARLGELKLAHGTVQTPVFMPVGTYGAVKTMAPDELLELGSQIILGNTYHLFLRPGLEVIDVFHGLHGFIQWKKPILTDSGGFQVFSLASNRDVSEDGVWFRSHLNGDKIFLSPELSAKIQRSLNSDIAMVLDECLALPSPLQKLDEAVERSYRWARRFLQEPKKDGQKIFGIFQGGLSKELRKKSLELTCSLPIDGLAIGGLSVGESFEDRNEIMKYIAPHLPEHLPHYLMGIGNPKDLLQSVHDGVDMFDCVLPTRNARNGGFFTDRGLINIRNQSHKLNPEPIDPGCTCPCCKSFSSAYVRHLFLTREILGARLATLHNLHYYHRLMQEIRASIQDGVFGAFYHSKMKLLSKAYPSDTSELAVEGE